MTRHSPHNICARPKRHKAKANKVAIRPIHSEALPFSAWALRSWPARKKNVKLVTIFRTASRVATWSTLKPATNCTTDTARSPMKGQERGDQLILRTPRWAQPTAHRTSVSKDRTIKVPHAHGCTA